MMNYDYSDFKNDCGDDGFLDDAKLAEIVDAHILKHFGIPKNGGFTASAMFRFNHRAFSSPVRVHVIESEQGIVFLTSGLSAYILGQNRFELMLAVPPKTQVKLNDSFCVWVLSLLQSVAVFAVEGNHPLEYGCTIDNGEPYTDSIKFSACVLVPAVCFSDNYEDSSAIKIDGTYDAHDDDIDLLRIVPIYKEELEYKLEYGYEALFTKLLGEAVFDGVRPNRPNMCA